MQPEDLVGRFRSFWQERGAVCIPSFPVVHSDPSVMFVNAGVTPFKRRMLGGAEIPVTAVVQRCLRARWNIPDGFCFEMMTIVGPGPAFARVAGDLVEFLVGAVGLDRSRLHYLVDPEDADLLFPVSHTSGPRISHQKGNNDDYWTRWEFGHGDRLTGRGGTVIWGPAMEDLTLADAGRLALGNLVLLDVPAHSKQYFDVGFGVGRVCAVFNDGREPPMMELLPLVRELVPTSDCQRLAQVWLAIVMLLDEGVQPAPRGPGHVLRRMLRYVLEQIDAVTQPAVASAFVSALAQSGSPTLPVGLHQRILATVEGERQAMTNVIASSRRRAKSFTLRHSTRPRAWLEHELRATFGLPQAEIDLLLNTLHQVVR